MEAQNKVIELYVKSMERKKKEEKEKSEKVRGNIFVANCVKS